MNYLFNTIRYSLIVETVGNFLERNWLFIILGLLFAILIKPVSLLMLVCEATKISGFLALFEMLIPFEGPTIIDDWRRAKAERHMPKVIEGQYEVVS